MQLSVLYVVATCLKNPAMSGKLTVLRKMSGNYQTKILLGKAVYC